MTFTDLISAQVSHMVAAAKRVDEKGYILLLYNANRDGIEHPSLPFGMFTGSTERLLKAWKASQRRKVVMVTVILSNNVLAQTKLKEGASPFSVPFHFHADVPRSTRLRPLVATLELMSTAQKGRSGKVTGVGVLKRTELSDRFEFAGEGRDALETVLRVLEMPIYRDILLGK